jgi:hypothetical protein
MEIDGSFQGWEQYGYGEDVRSSRTPTNHTCSFGKFGYGMNEEHKEKSINWGMDTFGCGKGHLGGMMETYDTKGAHTLLSL